MPPSQGILPKTHLDGNVTLVATKDSLVWILKCLNIHEYNMRNTWQRAWCLPRPAIRSMCNFRFTIPVLRENLKTQGTFSWRVGWSWILTNTCFKTIQILSNISAFLLHRRSLKIDEVRILIGGKHIRFLNGAYRVTILTSGSVDNFRLVNEQWSHHQETHRRPEPIRNFAHALMTVSWWQKHWLAQNAMSFGLTLTMLSYN